MFIKFASNVSIVVLSWLNQVCCLLLTLLSFVDILAWLKWDMVFFLYTWGSLPGPYLIHDLSQGL